MVDPRRTRPPRDYFSRREQGRLLMLVMSLGLAIFLFNEARKPERWRWLCGGAQAEQAREPAAPTKTAVWDRTSSPGQEDAGPSSERWGPAAMAEPSGAAGEPMGDAPSGKRFPGVNEEFLRAVRDKTFFHADERDAWFHLLAILKAADAAALRRGAIGRIAPVQLVEQSAAYRGELVTVRGVVHGTRWLIAPKNRYGITGYYQTWIEPDTDPAQPVVAYCLALPKGFPQGMDISKPAAVTGFYFKQWLYQAHDGLRLAPVILAKDLDPESPQSSLGPLPLGVLAVVALVGLTALAAALVVFHAYRQTRRPRRIQVASNDNILPPMLLLLAAWTLFVAGGELPAADLPQPDSPRAPSRAASSAPKELMRLAGVDEAQWARLQDDHPWNESDHRTLQTILLRLAQAPPADLERWSAGPLEAGQWAADPKARQGRLFRLRGRVRSMDVIRPTADLARRFGVDRYYRAEMGLDDVTQAVVYTRSAPRRWRRGGTIQQPGGAIGMFLAMENTGDGGSRPVFGASRLAAYPTNAPLAQLEMDVGLLDDLVDRQTLGPKEQECFYQALAAVGRAREGQFVKEAHRRLAAHGERFDSVVPLFNDPTGSRGKLVMLYGTIRRALLVRVDDPDIRRRFGIDHYYELYLYTPDSQGNPLVFCVRRLPNGMPTGTGADYAESATIAGFFLKSWAYASGLSRQSAHDDRPGPLQLAPLLVAPEPIWHGPGASQGLPIWGAAGAALLVLLLLGIWLRFVSRNRTHRPLADKRPTIGPFSEQS